MKQVLILLIFILVAIPIFAETYTGHAESIEVGYSKLEKGSELQTPMGIKFIVVIEDGQGQVVARYKQSIGTGTMTMTEAKQAIKNVVERETQNIYAHRSGALDVIKSKVELESYEVTCDTYVDPSLRKSPSD